MQNKIKMFVVAGAATLPFLYLNSGHAEIDLNTTKAEITPIQNGTPTVANNIQSPKPLDVKVKSADSNDSETTDGFTNLCREALGSNLPASDANGVLPGVLPVTLVPDTLEGVKAMQLRLKDCELTLERTILDLRQRELDLEMREADMRLHMTNDNAAAEKENFKWIDAKNGQVPKDAYGAGLEGKKDIHICRAKYSGSLAPGQLVEKGCLISYAGQAFVEKEYQVFTTEESNKFVWRPSTILADEFHSHPYPEIPYYSNKSAMPERYKIFQGGYENDQQPLFICRTVYNNTVHIGKVVEGSCNIGVDGKEVVNNSFEVLASILN